MPLSYQQINQYIIAPVDIKRCLSLFLGGSMYRLLQLCLKMGNMCPLYDGTGRLLQ